MVERVKAETGDQRKPRHKRPITPEEHAGRLDIRSYSLPPEVYAGLSLKEKEILTIVEKIPHPMARIYRLQVGTERYPAVYPPDITRQELESARKANLELIHPRTVVARGDLGLEAIPYHKYYRELLNDVRSVLSDAASAAATGQERDHNYFMYFTALSDSFRKGNYAKAEEVKLQTVPQAKIGLVATFSDTNSDTLSGYKTFAEGWTEVLDVETTRTLQKFADDFHQWSQDYTGLHVPKTFVRYAYVTRVFGQADRFNWTANNLPWERSVRREHGAYFTTFIQKFEEEFAAVRKPLFREVIHHSRRSGISDELLKKAAQRLDSGHEVAHPFMPDDVELRLKRQGAWVRELFCDVASIVGYSKLNTLEPREIEAAIGLALSDGMLEYQNFIDFKGVREEYYISKTIILNYLLSKESVSLEETASGDLRISWTDSKKVLSDLENLLSSVKRLIDYGEVGTIFYKGITFYYYLDSEVWKKIDVKEKPPRSKYLTPPRRELSSST